MRGKLTPLRGIAVPEHTILQNVFSKQNAPARRCGAPEPPAFKNGMPCLGMPWTLHLVGCRVVLSQQNMLVGYVHKLNNPKV